MAAKRAPIQPNSQFFGRGIEPTTMYIQDNWGIWYGPTPSLDFYHRLYQQANPQMGGMQTFEMLAAIGRGHNGHAGWGFIESPGAFESNASLNARAYQNGKSFAMAWFLVPIGFFALAVATGYAGFSVAAALTGLISFIVVPALFAADTGTTVRQSNMATQMEIARIDAAMQISDAEMQAGLQTGTLMCDACGVGQIDYDTTTHQTFCPHCGRRWRVRRSPNLYAPYLP